jgi:ATP-dependent exoDNAse (exonuclease V) beta subunit
MKTSQDKKVIFYEDSHSYYLGDKKLTSVTQHISQFKHPFNSEEIAQKYALKHNMKKEDVLQLWSDKGKKACEIGTFIHAMFEDYINDIIVKTHNDYSKCEIALIAIQELFESKRLIPVETEMIVYNDNYAGQIDCIAKNNKGEHFILDWKTNNKIDKVNPYQKMIKDYWFLDDCSFNHYSLQLSCYKEMCKEYDIKGCYLVHIKNDGYDVIKCKDLETNLN